MKRVILLFLFILLGLSMFGVYPAFRLLQIIARSHIKSRLQKEIPLASLVRISGQELAGTAEWEEEGKEFHLDGAMYDVVHTIDSAGTAIYYCIPDNNETHLYAWLDELTRQEMNDDHSPAGQTAHRLIKLLLLDYLQPAPLLFRQHFFDSPTYHVALNWFYKCVPAKYASPPPKLLV